jgi:hypothetical protein
MMTTMLTGRDTIKRRRTLKVWGVLLVAACAGCETCPPIMLVTLGNDTVVTANANTGWPSQANTVWAFHADAPIPALSVFSFIVERGPGFLFSAEFGPDGEVLRVFDNEVLIPDLLGAQLLLDNLWRAAEALGLFYVAESYGAEEGVSAGLVICGVFYSGPFWVVKGRIEYSGTTIDLIGRSDGTLRFSMELHPLLLLLTGGSNPDPVEVPAFALRE